MSGKRKFRTSIFGYRKKDVYDFIDGLANDLEQQINLKDKKIEELTKENKKLTQEVEEFTSELDKISNYRGHIADAIIKAEEKSKQIVSDAINESERKKKELQFEINKEKMRLERIKAEIKSLRQDAVNIIKQYQLQLVEVIDKYDESNNEQDDGNKEESFVTNSEYELEGNES